MNARQIQIQAFNYIAAKINQGREEAIEADESGIAMPDCFRGWFLEQEDFAEWLPARYKEHEIAIFEMVQELLGLQ